MHAIGGLFGGIMTGFLATDTIVPGTNAVFWNLSLSLNWFLFGYLLGVNGIFYATGNEG